MKTLGNADDKQEREIDPQRSYAWLPSGMMI